MRHYAGCGEYVHSGVCEDAGVVRGEYHGQLDNEIDAAAEGGLRSCPFIQQGRFAALDEIGGENDGHGLGGAELAGLFYVVEVPLVERVIFGNNPGDGVEHRDSPSFTVH